MEGNEIIPYIEPIYRFCCRRLSQRYDAEDLASEIVCHVLDGMGKYRIASLDAWVWRIAHNRYAMFLEARNRDKTVLTEDEALCAMSDSRRLYVDEEETEQKFDTVFRYLHTLSAEYRNIFIDYYIGELSVRELSKKYSLSETTVKWRLNVGRRKIRERIGEQDMEKVYRRINWNTTCCNGSMDSDRYLHAQISRAICQAAYQKPLTVEEISVRDSRAVHRGRAAPPGIWRCRLQDLEQICRQLHHFQPAGQEGYRGRFRADGAGNRGQVRGFAEKRG